MQVAATLVLGLALGMRHATDADHVVAVGTLVRRESGVRGALAQGVLWGLGHTLTVIVVGAAIVFGGLVVPPRAEGAMDLAVAGMLVGLGVVALRSVASPRDVRPSPARPVIVGIVHGLAGSAGVALLALTTIRDKAGALGYLAMFGAGTVAGMVLITLAIAAPFALAADRFERGYRIVIRATAAASIGLGLVMGASALV